MLAVLPPNRRELDLSCKHYPERFSPGKHAQALTQHAFPLVKRGAPTNCDAKEWLQKGSQCPVITFGENAATVSNHKHLTAERVAELKTAEGIAGLNREGIELALERRVALFFQQAILCYGMSKFTFSARGADDQIGTAPAITFSEQRGVRTTHKREAAHSSTIPTLIAHAKDGSTPNGIVYFKGGSSHYQHNATIGMHECVNGADELIDGKGNDGKLRETAVRILNTVADGLNPVEATRQFIAAYTVRTAQLLGEFEDVDNRRAVDPRKLVLQIYQRKMAEIQGSINARTFDYLIGVKINPGERNEDLLRDIFYKKRFDIIRLQEVIESRIGKRIADMQAGMDSRERSYLVHMILNGFHHEHERHIIEKLFAKTAAVFDEDYTVDQEGTERFNAGDKRALQTFRTRVANLCLKYHVQLDTLMRDLRADFRELRAAECTFRSGVFKDLREKYRNWTQPKFCDEYLRQTGHSISKTWVSRMEELARIPTKENYDTPINQRRKYVTLDEALNCARTFGVDSGIFLPCLFTS